MKTKTIFATMCLLLVPGLAFAATNDITELVRKGLFEEEANHNLDAAMQAYQSAVISFDQDRQLAATAVFRLGECYRKLGRTNEAAAQYQRILRDFPDQSQLADLSRSYLPQNQIPVSTPVPDSDMTSEERNELLRMQQMVNASPDLINGSYATGDTPLVSAAGNGWVRVVRLLLDSGANPNRLSGDGWMPICKAADAGNEQIVEMLLQHGADINGRNTSGKTALFYAARDGFLTIERTLLAHHADTALVNQLADGGLGWGATPLHAAAAGSDPRVAELLITNGANVNGLDSNGGTPLVDAIANQRLETARMLIAHGANVNVMVKSSGETPLFYAVLANSLPMVELLLTNGANVNVRDPVGGAPLQRALTDDMRQLLRRFGAGDDFERLGGIYIREKGMAGLGLIVFSKASDPEETHSLFEVLAVYYGIRWEQEPAVLGAWSFADPLSRIPNTYQPTRFPDFKHVIIDRLGGTNREQVTVDFDSIITAGDCSKNPSLLWGDVIEIAPLDHPLNQQVGGMTGLPHTTETTLAYCLQRTVDIVIKGQTNEVKLQPRAPTLGLQHDVITACDLQTAVDKCNLLLLSSDLTRVKLYRAGDAVREFNLASTPGTSPLYRWAGGTSDSRRAGFILHDGDVIDIPEK